MGGADLRCPSSLRDAVDLVAGPTTFFVGATLAFIALMRWRRFFANGLVGWSIVNLFLLYFGLSMTDYDFREIVTKPDNVPIVGLLISGRLFLLAWAAPRGDQRRPHRPGPAQPRGARAGKDADLARPGLHRADLHGGLTIVLVVWGIALPGPARAAGQLDHRPRTPRRRPGTSWAFRRCSSTSTPGWPACVLPSLIIVGLMAIPYIDTNKAGNGYYIVQRPQVCLPHLSVRLRRALGGPDPAGDLPARAELELLRSVRVLGPAQGDSAQQRAISPTSSGSSSWARASRRASWSASCRGSCSSWAISLITPYVLYRLFFKKYTKQAGMLRFLTLAILILFMAALADQDGAAVDDQPEVHGGYIPELFFNI